MTAGSNSYLAYFDANNHFNLAYDLKAGVNFDFANQFTSTTTVSTYAPALVSIRRFDAGLCVLVQFDRRQLCPDRSFRDDGIKFNTTAGCAGTIPGSNPTAGPSAQLIQTDVSGALTSEFLVAWPDNAGTIAKTVYTTTVAPDYSPIPA